MTQLEIAQSGNISPEMEAVAKAEKADIELIKERIADEQWLFRPMSSETDSFPAVSARGFLPRPTLTSVRHPTTAISILS